ncbi:class F sortase [Amycolatopsis sp. NPDC004368]
MRAEPTRVCCAVALVCAVCTPAPSTVVPAAPPPSAPARGIGPLPPAATTSPVRLTVPAIGIDVRELVPLALGPAHELAAPARFADVGWYAAGPVPGDPGPAVIAAHVDSRSGPAPFASSSTPCSGTRKARSRPTPSTASRRVPRCG